MYYVIRYQFLTDSVEKEQKKEFDPFVVDYGRFYAQLTPETEIFCFYRSANLIKIVCIDREYETRGYSINDIENMFAKRGFLRINRSVVINMKFAKGYSQGSKRDTLNVIFHSDLPPHFDSSLAIVTDKYLQDFKNALS